MNKTCYQTLIYPLHNTAKSFRYFSLTIRGALLLITSILFALGKLSTTLSVIGLVISIAAVFCEWRGMKLFKVADKLQRAHEFYDAFEVEVPQQVIMEAHLANNKKDINTEGSTFASNEAVGTKRAMENLRENAFWSSHLAKYSGIFFALIIAVLFVGCLIFIGIYAEQSHRYSLTIYGLLVLVAVLVLPGLIKIPYDLLIYSKQCADVASTEVTENQWKVAKNLCDYQISRISAAIIPTWIWKLSKDHLNEKWKSFIDQITKEA